MGRRLLRAMTTCALPALAACAQNYYTAADSITMTTERTVASEGVARVALDSRQGPITVMAGDQDSIEVRLGVGPARGAMGTRRSCDVDPGSLAVRAETSGSRLRLAAEPTLDDECVARWDLVLPRRMAVEVDVVAGHVAVDGITGGVDVTSNAGDAVVRIPRGPVEVRAGTGEIELTYEGTDFGAVTARTQVGSVKLRMMGRSLSHQGAPGSGDRLSLDGGSVNAIEVRATVGDVTLRLGPEGG